MYTTQDPKTRQKPSVLASVKRYEPTGVDEMVTMVLNFPRAKEDGGDAHAVATTGLKAASNPGGDRANTPAVRIQGEKGEIQVFPMIFRPLKTRVVWQEKGKEEEVKYWPQPGEGKGREGWEDGSGKLGEDGMEVAGGTGHGMFWEADEAARCVLEGRKEGGALGWEESVTIMEVSGVWFCQLCVSEDICLLMSLLQVMDEVRKQGGIKYPEAIESLDYPIDL